MCYLLFLMALWVERPCGTGGKGCGSMFPTLALFMIMASDVFLVLGVSPGKI